MKTNISNKDDYFIQITYRENYVSFSGHIYSIANHN